MIVSLVTGEAMAVYVGTSADRTLIMLMVVLHAALLGGTLGVLRKCQYRLMR